MERILYLLFILLLFQSCKRTKSEEIVISGIVKGIPANKLYLTDAYHWEVFLDSAYYTKGEFKFHYKPKNDFEPFVASICYIDDKNSTKKLLFKNFVLSTKDKIYGYDAFYLETGQTIINGDLKKDLRLSLKAGKETELLYTNQLNDYWGYVTEKKSVKRLEIIKQITKRINDNPESYYLLNCIVKYRMSYSKDELVEIFKVFDRSVQESKTGQLLNKYISLLNEAKLTFNNILLTNTIGKKENVVDSAKMINVIIFWGSWCGPCRQEIPQLKELYTTYSKKDIRMVSIAINDERDKWLKALEIEKMGWLQLFADNSQSEELKISFNIPSVPVIIITDRLGKELVRKRGFSNNNIEMPFILDSLLKSK